MLVHLLDRQVENLPEIHLGELPGHLLREYPSGHRRTVDDLQLEQFVDQNNHHLLVRGPQLVDVVQDADLCLLRFGQGAEYRMELGNGREAVRERLRAQIQQRLDEYIDFQGIKAAVGHLLAAVAAARDVLQDVDHLLGRAFLPDGHHQLMGHRGTRQTCCFRGRKVERFSEEMIQIICLHGGAFGFWRGILVSRSGEMVLLSLSYSVIRKVQFFEGNQGF